MNDNFVRTLVNWTLKNRLSILFLWVILILLACFQLIRFLSGSEAPIDNSVSIWFQKNDPELLRYQQFNAAFGEAEWTILLLKTAIDDDKSIVDHLAELAENIESIPHVQKAISLADFRRNQGDFPDPATHEVTKARNHNTTQQQLHKNRTSDGQLDLLVAQNPRLNGILYRDHDAGHLAILIKIDNLIDARTKYRIQALDRIRGLVSEKPWIQDHALAGTLIVNAEMNRAAEHNAIVFYFLISGLLLLLSLLTLKYYRDTLVLLAIVVGTVLPVMAGLSILGESYNMLTIMLPTMLAAFSVADIVHVIDLFHKERTSTWKSRGSSETASCIHSTAIINAIEQLWKPGLWTSLTTAIGLFALSRSDVIPVFQIGVAGPLGILWAWLQTVIVAPAMLSLLWNSSHEPTTHTSIKITTQDAYQRMVHWLISLHHLHPRKLLIGLCLMALPVLGLPWLEVDTNYAKFFRSDSRLPIDYSKVEQAEFAQNPLSLQVSIIAGKDITSHGIYRKIRQFETRLESLKPVEGIFSASVLMESLGGSLTRSDRHFDIATQESQQMVALLLERAKENGYKEFEDFIVPNGRKIQIIVMTNYLSSKELDALKMAILKTASETFSQDNISIAITGTTVLWASMDEHISKTLLHSIIFSFCVMGLLLPFIFRSFKLGLLGIAINFLPVSISLGVMALVDIKVNIATALIGSIAFGIVVDDTIHFLTRFNRNRTLGLSVTESISETSMVIGRSIITTSLVLVGSFATLASSSFLPSAHFGIFIALSVSLALYLDIFNLPLVLRFMHRKDVDRNTSPSQEKLYPTA